MTHSPPSAAQDPILAKIRKLLAKAEDQAATEQEAETYTAKAAALIADYGIDRALLAEEVPGSDVVGDRVVDLEPPYAKDKAELLAEVALSLRCRAVLRKRRSEAGSLHSVHLFGHESDLLRTDLLFTSLLMQSATWLRRTPVPPFDHAAAFRRSWMAGFRVAIVRRLDEAERDAEQRASHAAPITKSGRSAGLVLADRSRLVAERLSSTYPRLARARGRRLSGSGMADGYAAGQRADLGGASTGRFTGSRGSLPAS